MAGETVYLTDEQVAEIEALPCDMRYQAPFDFAWCERHDTTFALGSTCPHNREKLDI